MDRSLQHAFDAEEIMAYLDGELEPQRAAALAAHLVSCGECQEIAKGFRAVSERMMNFEVEPPSAKVNDAVLAALDSGKSPRTAAKDYAWGRSSRSLFARPRAWKLAAASIIAAILVVGISLEFRTQRGGSVDRSFVTTVRRSGTNVYQDNLETSKANPPVPAPPPPPNSLVTLNDLGVVADKNGLFHGLGDHAETSFSADGKPVGDELLAPETAGPMIAQTASLRIVATNYDEANAAIERLAATHGGYVEKLTAKAQTGSARDLSAALRIPAKQLDGFLADLRKLGHVEEESRENEEVSAQYVDLQARLKSARATEQRLIELLGTRTGKLSDVLDAERELARIRGEIESMQGQNAILIHRVSYATVQVELSEEYRERLSTTSKGTKIWNALVEGLGNLEDGAVAALIFLLAFGPSILLWLAVLALPVWLIWRRYRAHA
jgi:hypothetical protein